MYTEGHSAPNLLLLAIVHKHNLVLRNTETKGHHKLHLEIQEVCDVYRDTLQPADNARGAF